MTDHSDKRRHQGRSGAFSLIEFVLAMAIFTIMLLVVTGVVDRISSVWSMTEARVASYQSGRAGFEALTRNLAQATLKTYWDYDDRDSPRNYVRTSELHFVSAPSSQVFSTAGVTGLETTGHAVFFQAPLGHVSDGAFRGYDSLLSVCGYYIEFGDLSDRESQFARNRGLTPGRKFRLMEVLGPAESNPIYQSTLERQNNSSELALRYDLDWIERLGLASDAGPKQPLAENVIALILRPKLTPIEEARDGVIAPDFVYDSRRWEEVGDYDIAELTDNQMPPLIEAVMVVVSEGSMGRLMAEYGYTSEATYNADILQKAGIESSAFFTSAGSDQEFEDALEAYEERLDELQIEYEIFRTEVTVRSARWSGDPGSI